ncbi:DUF3347 domain-containing protein [Paracnuella aquatica]|uniref:DUF3347 domain-containing protein n=1 Tax=Paracnuella aquatica TaxID=2268757 RepID=UPI000DEFB552|nr:DUF3347 domain-containing protein [Paracnuella aquatica]RPD43506.1 DUF3347 domain-containing protein [Paracnuella aquatica]
MKTSIIKYKNKMRIDSKWTLPVAAVFMLITACGSNENREAKNESHDGHNHAATENPLTVPVQPQNVRIKDDNLHAVYQHYIHLRTALTKGDIAEAKIASNAVEAGAKEMQGGTSIAATAAKITAASDLKAQRTAFSSLSNDMIAMVKQSGLSSGELYLEYCPMALNDKGASWLSSEKKIENPYFGDEMLTCGEVKETIK